MSIPQNQMPERRANLALSFQELLTAIVRLRFNRQHVPDVESFKAQVRAGVRTAMQEGAARGYSREYIEIAAFAVVAFLDESILNSQNQVFAGWSARSLQEELFGKHLAGEAFFEYLERLQTQRDSAETADTLEVFYLCLLLGYRGKYGRSGAGEVRAMMLGVQDKIRRARGDTPLSPSAMLPLDPPQPVRKDPWFRGLAVAAGAALVAACAMFTIFAILLAGQASELESLIAR